MADPLIRRLRELAPFADDHAAGRALEATVAALWLRLYPEERDKLAVDLPSPVAQRLRARSPYDPRDYQHSSFAADVARKEQVRPAMGVEHAEVVCRALSELLTAETRTWLQERLPELAELFSQAGWAEPGADELISDPRRSQPDATNFAR